MKQPPRYSDVDQQKLVGATYTPPDFADFVADQIVRASELPTSGKIRILDPAVGDGALLDALIKRLPEEARQRVEAFGYDTDQEALDIASLRLKKDFPDLPITLEKIDFLTKLLVDDKDNGFVFQDQPLFHLVIANPPYVRTQVMGAKQAQQLAKSFDLTGRVDLYYPFLLGISKVLTGGGTAGVITSNRFMTTKSGQSVRRALLSRFKITKVWDLGDTKLFDAAVLPSVLLAQGTNNHHTPCSKGIEFSTIYETKNEPKFSANNALVALSFSDDSVVKIPDGRCFHIRHGILDNGNNPEEVWKIATPESDQWLATVDANTWGEFKQIGKIRVGVKSTADKVFVRNDWDNIPGGRPELVRPLITRHCARRYKAGVPAKDKNIKEILYPHEVIEGRRTAIDLNKYPISAQYLEEHRSTLEARTYLIDAGRNWYELWVPQDPSAWKLPKLVFPDISNKPIFWLDTDGGIVNGECYWLQCDKNTDEDLLWLALAIANSSFIEEFYDHRFNNKLYAGRRRFITQYVEQFPLPDPQRVETKNIIKIVKKIYAETPSDEATDLAAYLDILIWEVFGLEAKEVTG